MSKPNPFPLVSVILPTYNQENFVEEAVLSVVKQDYPNLQVVVSDDASQDQTPNILKRLAREYPDKISLTLNKRNLGITENVNQCLLQCQGEFIAFSAGDDIFLPGKIAKQVAFLQKHTEFAIAIHDVDVFDSATGTSLYLWSTRYGLHDTSLKTLVRHGSFIPGISVMARKKYIPQQGYDKRIRYASDWLLWITILANSPEKKIGYINQTLARYRRHTHNITLNWDAKLEDQLITLAIIESKWPFLLAHTRFRRSELFFTSAVQYLAKKQYTTALRYLHQSYIAGMPSPFPGWRLVIRELKFLLRNRKADDLLKSLLGKN